MQSTDVIKCVWPSFYQGPLRLLCFSELFVLLLLPSAATKVFCQRYESRYTGRADTAIFQVGEEGDVCALTVQYTHIKPHTDVYICSRTHTGGREVLVKCQAEGTK